MFMNSAQSWSRRCSAPIGLVVTQLAKAGGNIAGYVAADPINFTDPLGLCLESHVRSGGDCPDDPADKKRAREIAEKYGHLHPGGPGALERDVLAVLQGKMQFEDLLARARGEIVIIGQRVRDQVVSSVRLPFEFAERGLREAFTRTRDAIIGAFDSCGCFEAGTLVATPDGLKPIESIGVGDVVLAVNEATGEIAPKPVTDLIRPEPKQLYKLALTDAGGEAETFHATDDHPWKVEGKGWIETLDLQVGDRIDTASGADMTVTSLELTERVQQTYSLTVADWHTFMVGEDLAVVHNAPCIVYKTEHYRPRLPKGVSAAQANRAVGRQLGAIAGDLAGGSWVQGRVSINGHILRWSAYNHQGTIYVTSIHKVWK